MAIKIAPNGNSSGPNDLNFIHFTDEQSGVLLPNAPGYPSWLPSLQITLTGRLCFWNFPAKLLKSVISNNANIGTPEYLRDAKKVSSSNLFPPVPADLGTNGSGNQYFWNSCNTYFKLTADVRTAFVQQEVIREYYLNLLNNPNAKLTSDQILAAVDGPTVPAANKIAPVGAYYNRALYPWEWVSYNCQYYIDKYLKVPYDIGEGVAYTHNWIDQLNLAGQTGDLQKWLSGINLFIEPTGKPDFWDTVLNAAPVAILGLVTIASAGILSPYLITAMGAMTAAIKKSSGASQQADAQAAYDQANAGINTAVVTSDISAAGNPLTNMDDNTKKFIFFGLLVLIIAIILIIKNKSK